MTEPIIAAKRPSFFMVSIDSMNSYNTIVKITTRNIQTSEVITLTQQQGLPPSAKVSMPQGEGIL